MGEIIRAGVAGLGRAGWSLHALTLEQLPEQYEVGAVSDPNASRQREASDRLGCDTHDDYGDMLADDSLGLIVVASPSHLHEDFTVRAAEAGKHVLVEKPFATSLDGARRMMDAAASAGVAVTASQNYRYSPDCIKVREVIASGVLGEIVQIKMQWHRFARRWDWQTLKEYGGGELNNSGAHVIDQALLLLGDAEPEVACERRSTSLYSGDADNHVKVVLSAAGAPTVDIEITTNCAYAQDRWLIMGTQGGLRGSDSKLEWKYFDPSAVPARPIDREPTPDRSYNREDLPWAEEVYEAPRESFGVRNRRLYEDLHPSLVGDAPLAISAESVLRQITVLEKCRELAPV
ncbi:oxidoreductase [Candidatus Poribacteria bacterium]|nr:oxidoreductase [Candidatus Poribacteria bacterium]